MGEEILVVIRKNSRIDLRDLAILLGEGKIAVASEVTEVEEKHTICEYHTPINWGNTSEEKVMALTEIKVTLQRGAGFDRVAECTYQYSKAEAMHLVSGVYDFTVFIEGKTMRQIVQFVSDKLRPMESILNTATHFVLKRYRNRGTVINEQVQDGRMSITP